MRARHAGSADRIASVNRQPWNRLLAWVIDWISILAWVALIAAAGVPLWLAGITGGLTVVALNIIATLFLVVPVTLMLAWFESSARQASIGKHRSANTFAASSS